VRIWDVKEGKEAMAPLTGHTNAVTSVAFLPDCKLVVSGSWDKTVRIWDVKEGKEAMAPLRGDKSSWVGVPAEISDLAQRVGDGTTDKSRSEAFVVTAEADHVFVYSLLENHHKLDGDNTKEAVAQYRAPANITNISCMGKCVCVGLVDGQVCKLYLNVQKHFTFAMKPVCMELADRKKSKKILRAKNQKILNVAAHKSPCCTTILVCHTPKNNLHADDVFGCETFDEASWTSGTANKTMTFEKKVICATTQHLFGTFNFLGFGRRLLHII
jgi:WD40 repeat protein